MFPDGRPSRFIEFSVEAARLGASIRTALIHSGCVAYCNETLGHAQSGVDSRDQELWGSIEEVFGELELSQSLDDDTPLFEPSHTSFDVQLLNNSLEEEYLVQVTVSEPSKFQRWTVHKRLPDLLAVSRCTRQGRDATVDERSAGLELPDPRIWKEYHSLTSDQKEVS